jgi:hypothetical protein
MTTPRNAFQVPVRKGFLNGRIRWRRVRTRRLVVGRWPRQREITVVIIKASGGTP